MDGILSAVEGFWSSREETKQGCQVGYERTQEMQARPPEILNPNLLHPKT
jgi:hypothetical protein